MSNLQNTIKDLIFFYVKTNYEKYLIDNQIENIPDEEIKNVINKLYTDRKEHLKIFLKKSLKNLLKDEYPGDLIILNIFTDIFNDDDVCKNRLIIELRMYQKKTSNVNLNVY